jgi:NhaA family Na+:H+ antiporter
MGPPPPRGPMHFLMKFLELEAAGGFVLMGAMVLALLAANSPLRETYHALLTSHFEAGKLSVSFTEIVNDALMVIFFLVVGLEIKHEMLDGELSSFRRAALPFIGAAGGVACPALIYSAFNWGHVDSMRGWAIPTATDIAFSLGVLTLFGSRVPHGLRIFLMALAVIDDVIAVVIIAFFYTASLSIPALAAAAACVILLLAMARMRIATSLPYAVVGVALWCAVLASGVHATIAGVLLGFCLPARIAGGRAFFHDWNTVRIVQDRFLLRDWIGKLHPWVTFAIMPLFAFANSGIDFSGITAADMFHPVTLGIALGLFAGKQSGIMAASWLAVRAGVAALPAEVRWRQFWGVCLIAGIGFTMSLFIGLLAFTGDTQENHLRLGVLCGSFTSTLAGIMILLWASPRLHPLLENNHENKE